MSDKLTIKTNLVRKEPKFEPENCIVEKTIELTNTEFRELTTNALRDNAYIRNNRDLMFEDADGYHCLLFVNKESGDGFLVESEGASYARYAQFVPHAKDMLLAQEMTESEKELHNFFIEKTNDIINGKDGNLEVLYENFVDDPEVSRLFESYMSEIITNNPAVESAELCSDRIIVEKKELVETRLYCPLKIQVDDGDGYLEDIPSCTIKNYEDEINEAVEKSMRFEGSEDVWLKHGLIAYTDNERLKALVYSAFPSVEERKGSLYGVVTVETFGEISENDLADLTDEITGQLSDGWGEGFEQHEIDLGGDDYYISFWNCDNYFLKPESEIFPQQNMTMKM